MTQPLQTRRFKEALARVQQLFMETRDVKLTGFSSSAQGEGSSAARRLRPDSATMED